MLRLMENRQTGFSLLEVMASILLLAVAVLALLGVLILNLRATSKPVERQTASLIAASALDLAEARLRADWTYNVDRGLAPHLYHPDFEFSLYATDDNAMLKRLTAEVRWDDANGAQQLILRTAVENVP